jgi:AcrR family transcriptional regulator
MTPGSTSRSEPDRREKRRQAMLDAARELFVERGYDAVSLSEIVKRSGGSLATLYELFENKAGLLGAIVASKRFVTHEQIDAIAAGRGSPAEKIGAIADVIIDGFADAETIGLMRVVMGETLRDPAFAQTIFTAAHLPAVNRLAELFSDWADAGLAAIPDPMLTVHLFFGLIAYGQQARAFFGDACNATLPPRAALVREATAMFVSFYHISTAEAA